VRRFEVDPGERIDVLDRPEGLLAILQPESVPTVPPQS
jgi:hypothetical protein